VRVTALKCLREDPRRLPFESLAPLEACLRDMVAGHEADVRTEARYLLALHLLAAKRRSEVVALLGATEPPELGPILRLLVSRLHGPVNVEELLPHLRRALRVEDAAGFTPHAVHDLLSSEPTRAAMLAALDGWVREGDGVPMTADTLGFLVESLTNPDSSAPALRLLQAAAKRGAGISGTLPWLRVSLKGLLPTWFAGKTVPELIEALIDSDAGFDPLLRWLDLLALEKPAEAVTHIEEILERGQDVSTSRDAVKRVATEATEPEARASAAALLKRMQHPPGSAARRRMAQVKEGTLAFGGGMTTDAMAVLSTKDGKFFIGGPDVEPREVSRNRALAFLVSLYALRTRPLRRGTPPRRRSSS